MIFHVTVHPEEDGRIVTQRPALPGGVAQGRDEKDVRAKIKAAMDGWLRAEVQKSADIAAIT